VEKSLEKLERGKIPELLPPNKPEEQTSRAMKKADEEKRKGTGWASWKP